MYGMLGMVVNKKVMQEKLAASSAHNFCLWESIFADCNYKFEASISFRVVAIPHQNKQLHRRHY